MRTTPKSLSDRPIDLEDRVDVLSDMPDAVHLTTEVFGRLELGAPWKLRLPDQEDLSFYVGARPHCG